MASSLFVRRALQLSPHFHGSDQSPVRRWLKKMFRYGKRAPFDALVTGGVIGGFVQVSRYVDNIESYPSTKEGRSASSIRVFKPAPAFYSRISIIRLA